MTINRPLVKDRTVALVLGAVAFVIGAVLIHDAYDGRGIPTPWPLGAVMPW